MHDASKTAELGLKFNQQMQVNCHTHGDPQAAVWGRDQQPKHKPYSPAAITALIKACSKVLCVFNLSPSMLTMPDRGNKIGNYKPQVQNKNTPFCENPDTVCTWVK